MSQHITCDLCSKVTRPDDIRYIEFYKELEDMDYTAVHPKLEICAICMELVYHKVITIRRSLDAPDSNLSPIPPEKG